MLVLGSWLQYFLLISITATAVASLSHTIDDASGSVTYSPSGSWSQGNGCSVCTIHPDPSQATQGTWHDTTYVPGDSQPSVTVQFNGTAVYMYNILANTVPGALTTTTSLSFTLDGEDGPSFLHTPSTSTDLQYNQLVFAAEDLELTTHTLIMQATDGTESVILFDYISYTVPDNPPSETVPPSSTPPSLTPPSSTPPSSSSDITSSTSSSVITSVSTSSASSILVTTTTTPTTLVNSTSFLPISPIPATPSSGSPSTVASSTPSPSSPNATTPVFTSGSSRPETQTASPQPAAESSSTISIGVVAGGAVAGVVALFLLAILTFILCRRRVRASPYGLLKKEKRDATSGGVAHAESVQEQQDVGPEPDSASGLLIIGAAGTVSRTSSLRRSQRTFATLSYTDGYVTHRASLQDVPCSEPSMYSDLIESLEGSSTYRESRSSAQDGEEKALIRGSGNGLRPLPPPPPMPASTTDSSEPREVPSLRSGGNTALHAQVAALREEIERLRERQEMHFDEVLPGYDQV